MNGEPVRRGPSQVVFERDTGNVVATFRKLDLASGEVVATDADEVLAVVGPADGEAARLGVLSVETEAAAPPPVRVEPERAEVVVPPRLRLRVDRTELEGDGEDTATISINLVDAAGASVSGYGGTVHVTTTRGRLSARAGDVELEHGRGSVTLTSVRETVDSVTVRVAAADGTLLPGEATLRFV
jgi:hypothetical protein